MAVFRITRSQLLEVWDTVDKGIVSTATMLATAWKESKDGFDPDGNVTYNVLAERFEKDAFERNAMRLDQPYDERNYTSIGVCQMLGQVLKEKGYSIDKMFARHEFCKGYVRGRDKGEMTPAMKEYLAHCLTAYARHMSYLLQRWGSHELAFERYNGSGVDARNYAVEAMAILDGLQSDFPSA